MAPELVIYTYTHTHRHTTYVHKRIYFFQNSKKNKTKKPKLQIHTYMLITYIPIGHFLSLINNYIKKIPGFPKLIFSVDIFYMIQ